MRSLSIPQQPTTVQGGKLLAHRDDKGDPSLLLDTINLLAGERSGHMARHGFRTPKSEDDRSGGLVYWAENVKNPEFPANLESKMITDPANIARLMQHIETQSRHITVMEVGSGLYASVKTKTVPMIQHFLAANGQGEQRKVQYIAMDTADGLAADAAERIKGDIPGINTEFYQTDFTQIDKKILTEGHPTVAFLWGGTLWNTPSVKGIDTNQMIASQLTSLGRIIGVGGYVMMSHYWVPDDKIEQRLAPYETEANKATVKSILYAIQQDVEPTFDPESFEIKIDYNKSSRILTMSAESKVDQVITLSAVKNFQRALRAGERLTLVNSHKLDLRTIEEIAGKADFKVVDDVQDSQRNTGMVLLLNRGPR